LLEEAKAMRREPPLVDHASVVVKRLHLHGTEITVTQLDRLAAKLAKSRGITHQLFTSHAEDTGHTYSFQFNEARSRPGRR